ncbi:hypothetical protein DCAR_0100998 [Daucus carota subsp. sativus]|uniref:No apical meristem-associated C-terminal domain-containing protein n=1 Tax=Daucus carota subsp. sativus TaxID=79200 RepID=A0A162B0N6_DAUCS|nr:hypothetical protein DCAR_0100998 [Daucus carota subsp. sativus]
MKEKFMFVRHRNALRFSLKYQASMANKNKSAKEKEVSSQSVNLQMPMSLDSDEMIERPIGRKAAKKLKRAANEAKAEEGLEILKTIQNDALAIASSRRESIQVSLQLQKELVQLRLAKEDRERQNEERERQIYEASIMAMDTTKILPDLAKYYDALKVNIMKKM